MCIRDRVAGGLDPRVLGLYHGVPMSRRSTSFGAPYADTIYLFGANLERVCATRAALAERIRVTVLHETAHYFGYTERQLRRRGVACSRAAWQLTVADPRPHRPRAPASD